MSKEARFEVRCQEDELAAWKRAAANRNLSFSAWLRGCLNAESSTRSESQTPREVALPPVSRPEPVIVVKTRPGFKRHPKCHFDRCRRLQTPTCDLCRQANAENS